MVRFFRNVCIAMVSGAALSAVVQAIDMTRRGWHTGDGREIPVALAFGAVAGLVAFLGIKLLKGFARVLLEPNSD